MEAPIDQRAAMSIGRRKTGTRINFMTISIILPAEFIVFQANAKKQRFVGYYTLVDAVAFCYCYCCHDVIIELVRMAATVKIAAEETSMSAFYTQYVTKHLKMVMHNNHMSNYSRRSTPKLTAQHSRKRLT
uniref:Uncharacterized protein n=1 Tax=Glossina austeni TaxID=7395 RepID=A0A1A9UUG7_GLOAU